MSARIVARLLAVSGVAMTAVACGSDSGGAPNSGRPRLTDAGRTAAPSLSDADAPAAVLPIGRKADVGGEGVSVQVKSVDIQTGGTTLLKTTLRLENTSSRSASSPDIGILCSGNGELGGYFIGSSLTVGGSLPATSFKEGFLLLGIPGAATGDDKPCAKPAFIAAQDYGGTEIRWRLPDQFIAPLNRGSN